MVMTSVPLCLSISIHALREEGDVSSLEDATSSIISIHALREEGDPAKRLGGSAPKNFNPRPPRGGRHGIRHLREVKLWISIHALREEGDPTASETKPAAINFNPRPPRGGRLTLPK